MKKVLFILATIIILAILALLFSSNQILAIHMQKHRGVDSLVTVTAKKSLIKTLEKIM